MIEISIVDGSSYLLSNLKIKSKQCSNPNNLVVK